MKQAVRTFMFCLLTVGNVLCSASSYNLQGFIAGQGEKEVPIKTVSCDFPTINKLDSARVVEDNTVKLALYDAVVSGRDVVRAKKACYTIEGDPVPIYATAKGGKIKITQDYSQDRWLKFQGILKIFGSNSYTTRKVELGYFDQDKFILLNGTEPNGRRLFLRLKGKKYF